ncbi:hypothetical protein V6251_01975 [Olleya sp. Ti.3.14]|uniref:toxin-antitoxin system YwqK family antitoxin n=1 Tax=Olleya sp. Ti.3.14 TaxID=3121297 RepID=UPI00311E00AF
MNSILKIKLLVVFFLVFINSLISQDYSQLADQYFNDHNPENVAFVKNVIEDNNAEQLVIDWQDLEEEHELDLMESESKMNDLNVSFKINNKNPDDTAICKAFEANHNKRKELDRRMSTLKAMMTLSETTYNLCKNNIYNKSNCNKEYNNYSNNVKLYNNAVNEGLRGKNEYLNSRTKCIEVNENYKNERSDINRVIDRVKDEFESRSIKREESIKNISEQIRDLILKTPRKTMTYFNDGKVKQECSVDLRTNKFVGELKKYHANGKLFVTTNFKDGVQHGIFTQYFENGGVEYKIKYENGEETGSTTYDQKGNIVSQNNMD